MPSIYLLASVHPLSLLHLIDCGGAPAKSDANMRFRGYMNIGGRYDPAALKAQTTVTVVPRSTLVILPTVWMPLVATIFVGR